jgi:PAS domain S-box-containing protein
MIEHNKLLIKKKEQEIAQYMDIMNSIASIFKIDNNGQIIEGNALLSELSEYSTEELLSMNIKDILPPEAMVTNYNDIVKLIGNSETYNGKIKFQSKSANTFYLNMTIIPATNDSTGQLSGFICIGLDQTDTETEKQQTMQRIRQNIMQQRSKESVLESKIKVLEEQNMKLQQDATNGKDTDFIISSLNKEKQKVLALNAQVSHYEKEVSNLTKQKNQIVSDEKIKRTELLQKNKELREETSNQQSKIIELNTLINKLQHKETTVG